MATVNAGPDQMTCVNTNGGQGIVQLSGMVGGSATGGTWTASVPGGTFSPNANALNAYYTAPTGNTGPITLTLTTNGPCPASDALVVTYGPVAPLTLAAVSATTAQCGDMLTITIQAANGFNDISSLQYSVNWDPTKLKYFSHNAAFIGGGQGATNPADSASGILTYAWFDPTGSTGEDLPDNSVILTLMMKVLGSSGTANVNITSTPTPIEATNAQFCLLQVITQNNAVITFTPITVTCPANQAVCVDAAPFTLTGGLPAGGTYSGPGVSAGMFNPATANLGPNTITYAYTAPNGCSNSCTFVITVNPLPTPMITGTLSACVGFTSQLSATPAGGSWSSDDTDIATVDNNGLVTGVAGGSTTIVYAVTDANGCSAVANVVFTVNSVPTILPVVVQPTTCVSADGSITLTLGGAPGPYTFNWATPNGSGLVNGQQNQTGLTVGTYNVTVTAANGCSATASYALMGPGGCNVCPTIGALSSTPVGPICANTPVTLTASGLTDMGITYGIIFKYYNAPAADPYTGGTVIATVPNGALLGGGTSAQTTAAFPVAGTYYLYAILTPAPTDPACRPSATLTLVVNALPTAAIAVTETSGTTPNDAIICAGASATLTASGGTSYLWSTGGVTAAIVVNPPGTTTYTVTITDANGCTATATQTITVNPLPTAAIAVTETSGTTNNDGTICAGASATLTASGGTSYLWSTGAVTAAITVNPPGTTTYTVTVTNANGCSATATQTITVNPLPPAAIAVTETSGTTNNDGIICAGASATLTASGGTSYLWSTGAVTAVITVNPPGTTTYTVTVTNANGCSATATQTITVNPLPTAEIAVTETSGTTNNDAIICAGASATLTASGGTSYLWSTGAVTAAIVVNPPGTTTYTVTVTNANGCSATATQTITVNPLPTAAIAVTETSGTTNNDGIICAGASATLTASGGTSYLWSTGAATAAITVNPGATTTYTVTVTNGNNCSATATQTITVNPLPTAAITVTETSGTTPDDGIICEGASATLTASGGTSYLWSTGAVTAAIVVNPPGTTTYTVTVTNANGCSATATQTITVNPLPTAAIAVTETSGTTNNDGILCAGASVTLTASGGTSYLWSTGAATAAITVNPGATTTYTVTVTNANGCSATATQTITVNPLPPAAIAVTETSGTPNDGIICMGASATLTASGGTSYLWSTGAVTAAITVMPASTTTYTVTVTNADGCSATATQTIVVNTATSAAIVVTETSGTTNNDGIICAGASATLTASGGTTYLWSTGAVTAAITVMPLATTVYTVTVSNGGSCSSTATQTITVNPLPTAAIAVTETSGTTNNDGILCAGASATLTASGGTSYLWSTGAVTAAITVNPGATTTYTVTVTNADGCSATATQTITVNPLPPAAIAVAETSGTTNNDGILCAGASATLTASGGTAYLWSTGAVTAAITVNPGATTTYTVTVTNANGCSATATQTITVNPLPTAAITVTETSGTTNNDAIICAGASATLTASGGTSYLWSTGAVTAAITVNPGATTTYTVTVTNANGCSATASQTITVNPLPTAAIAVTETSGTTNNDGVICAGASATLTASGGTSYLWSTGAVTAAITVNPGATTTYTVTVTNADGCSATATQTITVNPLPPAAITVTETSGTTNNDGILCAGASATLTASGGTAYLWSTGAVTAAITVNPGVTTTYTVTVTNANGCSATATQTITVNPLPTAAITVTETSGTTNNDGIICAGASATLTASGGTSYLWSTGAVTAAITVNPGATTTYTVTVTNSNGCSATATQTITVNPLPTAAITVTETSGTTPNDGVICAGAAATLTASGGTSYLWSTGAVTAAITVNPGATTTYTVTVTNANGCSATATQTITVNPLPTAAIAVTETSGTTPNDAIICAGASATLTASGGTSYLWSTGAVTAAITVNPGATTTYTVTVTNANGCSATATQTITVNPLPTAAIAVTETSGTPNDGIICAGASATLTASGGTAYLWSTGAVTAAITVTPGATTTYTVTVTNANGCSATATQTITVNPLPTTAIVVTETSGTTPNDGIICAGASVTLTASGGTAYLWSTGAVTAAITVNPGATTTYTVTITNGSNCSVTATQTITVNPLPTAAITVTEASGTTNNDAIICAGASATLTASGGTAYLWSTGAVTAAITVNPGATTTYTVTVTNANGCSATATQTITVNPLPTAAISVTETSGTTNNDGIICAGASATLTALGGGTYVWSTGATTAAITVMPGATTTYTVTVSNANGCSATATQTITVNPLPTAAIAVTETSGTTPNDGIICAGASATLTASGGTAYLWSTGAVTAAITVNPGATTTYTVTVSNANGCSATATQTITVNPLPTAAIAVTETSGTPNDGIICTGASATLTASGVGTYLWSTGATTAAITVTPGATTTYTVTVTNTSGCTATATQTITVSPLSGVAITVTENSGTTPNDGIICAGASATLTASGGTSYVWSTGATTAAITVTPGATTTYTVTVSNAAGCSATVTQTITVNPLPTAAIAVTETSGTTNNDGSICMGASATLTASGGTAYLWSTGATTAAITVTPGATTTYTVTVTNANGCSATATQTITVNFLPAAAIAVTENSGTPNDGIICTGASATLTASGGSFYLWSTGATTAAITVMPAATTTYIVTVTNAAGCSATATQTITVSPLGGVAITVTETSGTTPNDGIICAGASATLTASGGTVYLWSTGATTAAITVTPGATTTYTVTVSNAAGCSATATQTITVNPLPTAAIAVTETSGTPNDGIICGGASATLTASGGTSYVWSTGATTAAITVTPATTTTYTVTITNANGCTATATQTITVTPQPTLFTVTGGGTFCAGGPGVPVGLSGSQANVNYQLQVNNVNTGAPVAGTGAALNFGTFTTPGTYTVVATAQGGCTATMTGSVTVASFNCNIIVSDPCVCLNNATTLTNGQFGETIKVNAPSTQVWTVTAITGLYQTGSPAPPAAPLPITVGTVLTNLGPAMNMFTLTGVHVDAIGYSVTVTNQAGVSLTIGNSCSYPNPAITSDLSADYCLGSDPVTLTGTPGDANIVSQGFTVNGAAATVFDPAQGVGQYVIVYTVNGGVPKAFGPTDPGCVQSVTQYVNVLATPSNLVCNDLVQISLDQNCFAEVLPDMILEGSYGCYDDYIVELDKTLPYGNGPWVPAILGPDDIGKTYQVRVTHVISGNRCWGNIKVEDKLAPVLTCTDLDLVCAVTDYSPEYLFNVLGLANAYPAVDENCGPYTLTYSDTWFDLPCDDPDDLSAYVQRIWTAKDASNNTATCTQYLYFERLHVYDVLFPADVTVDCSLAQTGPAATGTPYVTFLGETYNLLPNTTFCELGVVYTDQVIPVCDGSYKILRTWTVVDWCLPTSPFPPTSNPQYYIQLIKVLDETGPAFVCPADLTVSTDPFTCCATADLPDMIITDNCSRINHLSAKVTTHDAETGAVLATYTYQGTLTDFPGNNIWNSDTLGQFGYTLNCLPVGEHTVVYTVTDDCGNHTTCTFDLTVADLTPPVAACQQVTTVALGVDGMALVNASSFDSGSDDNCSPITLKVRRMNTSDCVPENEMFDDQVKFCCSDLGMDSILVILRVYDIDVPVGPVSQDFGEGHYNECMVRALVQDKLKPACVSPANVSVSCENFDPTLWAYGNATALDNCCLDSTLVYQNQFGLTHTANYSLFDTVCNRGTITRTFRAFDCSGQSSQCTQRIFVTYEQDYYVRFPNDVIVTVCDGTGNYGEPTFYGEDCELLGVSFEDEIFTVVPDACFKIERTWTIINWCTYDPNLPCIYVPNPNPNAITNHPQNLPGPIVSPLGTPAPWAPTLVKIAPSDPAQTNYSIFYDADANCYKYKQIIKIIDTKAPTADCPPSPQTFCDLTANDPTLWNEMYWWDGVISSHDLCEGPADLQITATDDCSLANIQIEYLLFLDLDGNGTMETVISSTNLPGVNNVYYGNALNPNFSGGTPRAFDERGLPLNLQYRFGIDRIKSGNNRVAAVRWFTLAQESAAPNNETSLTGTIPELPYGTHKIKWIISDGCGNQYVCEYTFIVKDCKPPTVVCINGLSVNIMPTGMITLWATDFLQYAEDNCTPPTPYTAGPDQLQYAIVKSAESTGVFPVDGFGQPITNVNFTCDELGTQTVQLWARDLAGNAAYCETYVIVQDPFDFCNTDQLTVAGAVKTEPAAGEQGVEEANVVLEGTPPNGLPPVSMFQNSNNQGLYAFGNALPLASNYTVTPVKDDNPMNGVSTFDLVLMSKHILGSEPLNSPYKIIAADVNKSNSVTTFDIVELRKLILGIYTELPNNTSWRFLDKGFMFVEPANPFASLPFAENISLADMQSDEIAEDFVGVKIGDLNGSVVANATQQAEDRTAGTLLLDVSFTPSSSPNGEGSGSDRQIKAGETFEVTFKADQPVQGFQFTLNLNGLEVADIIEQGKVTAGNFGIFEDALTASIDGAETFTVKFRATKAGKLRDMLQLSSRITRSEAYSANGQRLDVALRFSGQTIAGVGFELYQNQPNPWVGKTQVGFHLPVATSATLTVYDETGRVLFTQTGDYAKGYNAVTLDRAVLNTVGVLYYKLETSTDSATRKMVQTK